MALKWLNDGSASVVDIQPGGPGNPIMILDPDGSIDAPSGGGRDRTTLWGRGDRGGLQPRGFVYSGNPGDWTFNISYRLTAENFLKRLDCPFSVQARQYCGANKGVVNSYAAPGIRRYVETTITSYNHDNGLSMMDGQGTDLLRQGAGTSTLELVYTPVAHDDISSTTQDVAVNRILNIGARICAGQCGLEGTEEDSYIWVTDKDSTPAYAGNPAPYFYYTLDGGTTRNQVRIGVFTNSDALDVVYTGDKVIVFSDTKTPAYARWQDILNGVVDPNLWNFATGFSAISGSNFPRAAVAVDSSTILAVGAGGRIWLSTDGGLSFTLIYDTATLTSQNLLAIDAQPGGNAFAGGNSGAYIRLIKNPGTNSYTGSLIVVKDASANTLSSNINSVRTPPGRGSEVYLGTAGGEIWRTRNATATVVVFKNMTFVGGASGSITDMGFINYNGDCFFVVQTSAASTSRVLRDLSGGSLGGMEEVIGDFTDPSNFKINSIAPANGNSWLSAGEVHETYAFMGKGRPA